MKLYSLPFCLCLGMNWVVLLLTNSFYQVLRLRIALTLDFSISLLQVCQHSGYQIFIPFLKWYALLFAPTQLFWIFIHVFIPFQIWQAFKCLNLREISLDFARQENDTTDLATMMECLGRTCPRLKNIHIASIHLSNEVVLALTSANLRWVLSLDCVQQRI